MLETTGRLKKTRALCLSRWWRLRRTHEWRIWRRTPSRKAIRIGAATPTSASSMPSSAATSLIRTRRTRCAPRQSTEKLSGRAAWQASTRSSSRARLTPFRVPLPRFAAYFRRPVPPPRHPARRRPAAVRAAQPRRLQRDQGGHCRVGGADRLQALCQEGGGGGLLLWQSMRNMRASLRREACVSSPAAGRCARSLDPRCRRPLRPCRLVRVR